VLGPAELRVAVQLDHVRLLELLGTLKDWKPPLAPVGVSRNVSCGSEDTVKPFVPAPGKPLIIGCVQESSCGLFPSLRLGYSEYKGPFLGSTSLRKRRSAQLGC